MLGVLPDEFKLLGFRAAWIAGLGKFSRFAEKQAHTPPERSPVTRLRPPTKEGRGPACLCSLKEERSAPASGGSETILHSRLRARGAGPRVRWLKLVNQTRAVQSSSLSPP